MHCPLPSYVPPCGPVKRNDQLPGSAALAAAVVNINAAEAATIIAFIAVSPLVPRRRLTGAMVTKMAAAFCLGFAGRSANIAIYCKRDLQLAP